MSNEIIEFNPEQLSIIKSMFCSNATDMEFKLFIEMAKSLGLDPKKREIYFIKYGTGDKAKPTMIVGIDGYRKIAERSGRYMPGREPSFTYKNNALFSSTSYVKKLGPDKQWHEIGATAILSEYDAGQGQWRKMPHAMLAKCAESLALRRAFPSEMAGTYTEEEMEQANKQAINDPVDIGSKSLVVEIPVETIPLGDAIEIENMIGLDKEYRARILGFYKKENFTDVPLAALKTILEKVELHNQEKEKALEELG